MAAYEDFFGSPQPAAKAPTNKKGQVIPIPKSSAPAVQEFFAPTPEKTATQKAAATHAFNPENPDFQKNMDATFGGATTSTAKNFFKPSTFLQGIISGAKQAGTFVKQNTYDPIAHPSEGSKQIEANLPDKTAAEKILKTLAKPAVRYFLAPITEGFGKDVGGTIAAGFPKTTPMEDINQFLNAATFSLGMTGLVYGGSKSLGDRLATKTRTVEVTPSMIKEVLTENPVALKQNPAVRVVLEILEKNNTGFKLNLDRPAGGVRQAAGEFLGGEAATGTKIQAERGAPALAGDTAAPFSGAGTAEIAPFRQQLSISDTAPVKGKSVTPATGTFVLGFRDALGVPEDSTIKGETTSIPVVNTSSSTFQQKLAEVAPPSKSIIDNSEKSRFTTGADIVKTIEKEGPGLGFQLNRTEIKQLVDHLVSNAEGNQDISTWGGKVKVGTVYKSYGGGKDVVIGKVSGTPGTGFSGDSMIVAQIKDNGKLDGRFRTHATPVQSKDIIAILNDKQFAQLAGETVKEKSAPASQPAPVPTEVTTPKPSTTIELNAGINPNVDKFIDQDIKPNVEAAAHGLVETVKLARDIIAPRAGAKPASVDAFMTMKGQRNKEAYIMQKVLQDASKMFKKMPVEDQIKFIDDYKTGQAHGDENLQAYADFRRTYDKQLFDEMQKYKPDVDWKENHLRVLWDKIPGAAPSTMMGRVMKGRSLQGSMGMLKQSTLPDMSTGLAAGGVPKTYNPAELDNLAWADTIKYISAQKMWKILKDNGSRELLAAGKPVPEGKALVNDRIANLYYGGGRWVLDKGDARLLNNMLSKDWIREHGIGRAAFMAKNFYTSIEVGLSGFHAVFVSTDAAVSQLALGFQKLANQGVRDAMRGIYHADPAQVKQAIKAIAEGTKDIVTSPISPFTTARLGGKAIKSIAGGAKSLSGKDLAEAHAEFKKTSIGKWMTKQYGDYTELTNLLFEGGLSPHMDSSYRSNSIKTFKDSIYSGNYIGGAIRSPFALNQAIMTPLFNVYIPRLKWGVGMRMLANELVENQDRLASGKTTKEAIARDVVNSVENRLGEMDFGNLFWNNTFKSALQLLFRSVTWSGGSIREIGGAPYQQAREFYQAVKEKRAPRLVPKMAYIFALMVLQAVMAEVVQYLETGKHISSFHDFYAPKVDDQGNRVVIPTYVKDVVSFKRSPGQFVQHKFTGLIGKVLEDMENKDYYSNEIYHADDPAWLKTTKIAWNLHPQPFSITSLQNSDKNSEKAMSFVGLNRAPKYLQNTDTQNRIYDLYNKRFGGGTKSELQEQKADTSSEYKRLLRQGKDQEAAEVKAKAIEDGVYTERGFGRIETNMKQGTDKVLFDRLPQDDKDLLAKSMTQAEKDYYINDKAGHTGNRSSRGSRAGRSE